MASKGMNPRAQRDNEPTLEYARYLHGKITHIHPHQESYVTIGPTHEQVAQIGLMERLIRYDAGEEAVDEVLKNFRKEDMEKYPLYV